MKGKESRGKWREWKESMGSEEIERKVWEVKGMKGKYGKWMEWKESMGSEGNERKVGEGKGMNGK